MASLENDRRPRVDGYVQAQLTKKPPYSVEASGYEKKPGETIPRRNPLAKDELIVLPSDDVKTIYDNLKRAAAKFGNAKAIGSRKIIKTHVENKKVKKMVDGQEQELDKKWTYYELSGYTYMTFVEYEKLAHDIGSGLRNLGVSKDDKMHLYGATRCAEAICILVLILTSTVLTGLPPHTQLRLSLFPLSQPTIL